MNSLTKPQHEMVLKALENQLQSLEEGFKGAIDQIAILRSTVLQELENDDLTHLLRKGYFQAKLQQMLLDSERRGACVNVMLIDLDHFKSINDQYGHQKGDEVLERVSNLVKNYLRPQDIAGRFGGEELIVAVECSPQVAQEIAQRLRVAVEQVSFVGPNGYKQKEFNITMSLGLADTKHFGYNAEALIQQADRLLYEAKNSGRNQVKVA